LFIHLLILSNPSLSTLFYWIAFSSYSNLISYLVERPVTVRITLIILLHARAATLIEIVQRILK